MGLLPKGCIPPKAAKKNRKDNSKSAYMRLACVKYRLRFSGQLVEILDNFGKLLWIYANTVYLRKSVVNMATATTTFPPKQQITTRVYFKGCFPQAHNTSVINEMQTRCLAFVKKFTQQMVLLNSPLRMLLVSMNLYTPVTRCLKIKF